MKALRCLKVENSQVFEREIRVEAFGFEVVLPG